MQFKGYVDGLKEQLAKIRDIKVSFSNYVHDHFKDHEIYAQQMIIRRHLVLDLSRQNNNAAVSISKISEISPRISNRDLGKTKRTVMRDINLLEKSATDRKV